MAHYDYIFSGWGASSCLLLCEMHKSGLLQGRKALIIDPSNKTKNDKTFCFWANHEADIVQSFLPIISFTWDYIQIDDRPPQAIAPLCYYHINSLDLYNLSRQIMAECGVEYISEQVKNIYSQHGVTVESENGTYHAQWAFDSRPPKYRNGETAHKSILQTFYGYQVRLAQANFDQDACTLMDFEVAQANFTQFIYILPFGKDVGLVELTRFGSAPLRAEEAEPILNSYILAKFGQYEILDKESGTIPMSTQMPDQVLIEQVVQLGTRAGKVKPSSGYAFKNMYEQAKEICANKKINHPLPKIKARFRFYDEILILILSRWPHAGKPIFQQLFRVRSTRYVLRFLEEKTSLGEDIKMFGQLPLKIFFKALFYFIFFRLKPFGSALWLIAIAFFYLLAHAVHPEMSNALSYLVIALGLVLIGIPHGAMDHLTGGLNQQKQITVPFILKYLLIMAVVFAVWYVSPTIGLLAFILYSAWHFGQTDAEDWQIGHTAIGFFWGLAFLLILLFTHLPELNEVLTILAVPTIGTVESTKYGLLFSGVLWLVCLVAAIYLKKLEWALVLAYLLVACTLPLVIAFGFYFIFHHSWKGWSHLRQNLKKSHGQMFKNALPFNLGAMFLFGGFFLSTEKSLEENIAFFFVFISCISLPHILCMHRFYDTRWEHIGKTSQ
jgi:lycopene beta-cyclase